MNMMAVIAREKVSDSQIFRRALTGCCKVAPFHPLLTKRPAFLFFFALFCCAVFLVVDVKVYEPLTEQELERLWRDSVTKKKASKAG